VDLAAYVPVETAAVAEESGALAELEEIEAGEEVRVPVGERTLSLEARERIPFGFKIALQDIARGDIIRKYGETIGKASRAIAKGALVHIHNLEGTRARGDLAKGGQP
jgi:altronate dehydratase small subunit